MTWIAGVLTGTPEAESDSLGLRAHDLTPLLEERGFV
jgi:hypothetical protein